MRVPVYARGADPRVARWILKKSLVYCEQQVEALLADWVDPARHRLGIVPREFLPSGKAVPAVLAAAELAKIKHQLGKLRSGLPPLEPDGCKFIPPASMEINSTLTRAKIQNALVASMSWDWSAEPATA